MLDASPIMVTASDRSIGHLLEFLAPGLVHGFGNSLFAIRGAAHVLGAADRDPMHSQRVVVDATEQAEVLLEILRYLSGVDPVRPLQQPGVLLQRLVRVLRIPLRDHGLRVEFEHGSHESPVAVDASALTRAICEVVAALTRAVPRGMQGRVWIDLAAQKRKFARIEVGIEADASFLPFPLALDAVVGSVREPLTRDGVAVEVGDERIVLTAR